MRLITLSLFAFLLAVSAFGQPDDPWREYPSTPEYRPTSFDPWMGSVTVTPSNRSRRCSGVLVNQLWVLTHANCVLGRHSRTPLAQRPPLSFLHLVPAGGTFDSVRALRTVVGSMDTALVQWPCRIESGTPQSNAIAKLADSQSPTVQAAIGASFDAVVVPAVYTGPIRAPINGNAFKGADRWTVQGLDAEWPQPNDFSGLGAPLYVNEEVVGLYTGKVDGVDTFIDLTSSQLREWVYSTIARETLEIPELCGGRQSPVIRWPAR